MLRYSSIFSACALLAAACAAPQNAPVATSSAEVKLEGPVDIQVLAFNDFHGHLEKTTPGTIVYATGKSVVAGGAAYLSTMIKGLRAENENTVVVSAGDMIGASPLTSALFHDEPTIEVMNEIGVDYHALGNHEFDEGPAELVRMQEGGCHPVDGCQDGDDFEGARFRFLSGNVYGENGHTLFPPYKVRSFSGAKVAFIGLGLETTPTVVTPAGVAGMTFTDEAETANELIAYLRGKGVEAFVVLVHEGGAQRGLYNACDTLTGNIVDIADRLDPAVDVVVSAHTHNAYNCTRPDGKLVTSASSFGRLVTQINLKVNRATGKVESKSARNRIVVNTSVPNDPALQALTPDPAVDAIIEKYRAIVAPLANRVIGSITADINRTLLANGGRDETKESALGDVIADAQLAATSAPAKGGAVIAFMNPGGIRTDLKFAQNPAVGEGDGNVTYGEAFAVQPFGNSLVTMTMTGAQIVALLGQQFAPAQGLGRILQISNGFSYSYSASTKAVGNIMLNGAALDAAASYRVTMNIFLADGGDNFTVFRQGTERLGGDVDLDALTAYLAANSPVAPGPRNRVTVLP